MATTFLEPGGDADFAIASVNGFWLPTGVPAVVSDFVHGTHQKSIKYPANGINIVNTQKNTSINLIQDTGTRISRYLYIVALPSATASFVALHTSPTGTDIDLIQIRLTAGGILQLWNGTTAQIGTNGATLSTGIWYRISLAYTITSTTVNRFELFKDGVSTISVTNATIAGTLTRGLRIGNIAGNSTLDFRSSDHYIDNSSALTDPGNIWVTAKRPFSNGTTNGFTTQIGSGGSGYGSGHAPQVNERPLSTTNGWSMIGAGSAITEEYNIEAASVGDIDLTNATIVDYEGWISTSSLASETASIIVNGVTTAQAITSTNTLYNKIAGSTTYPAGTGADIGMVTSTTLTTVSLFECGVIIAFIPGIAPTVTPPPAPTLAFLGAG